MSEGVVWNLYCPKCKRAWMEKLFGSEVLCTCGNSITVGYRPVGHGHKVQNKPRGPLPEAFRHGPEIPKGSGTTKHG